MAITYHAGKRIQGLSTDTIETVTFEDDFSVDPNGWTKQASATITGGYLYTLTSQSCSTGTYSYKSFAIGNPTNFVLDFDWEFVDSKLPFIMLSSTASGYGAASSGNKKLIIKIHDATIGIDHRYFLSGASELEDNGVSDSAQPSLNTVYYYRIVKSGATITFKRYGSDANRTSDSSVQQTLSMSITESGYTGTAGFTNISVGAYGTYGGDSGSNKLHDFKFYSGVTSISSKPTDIQVGSRFEETDTRKMYHYNEPAFNKTGLKVYWKFDEASGDIVNQAETVGSTDSIGTGANLQVTGASYNQSNTPFNTMNFDGTNDDAVAGSSTSQFNFLHDGSKWTIAMWLENSDVTQPAVLLSNATGSNTQASKVYYSGNNSSGFIGGVYDSGIWINGALGKVGLVNDAPNFIVFTFDKDESSDKYTYYKNAVEMSAINQSTSQGSSSNSAIPMYLMSQAGADKFEGNIAEMSIWERILTDAEITTLYNSGNGVRLADATQSATWEELGT